MRGVMYLEDEQRELLGKFVEAHLSTAKERRGPFICVWPHNDTQATFFHSRERESRFQGNLSDARVLARSGFLDESPGSGNSTVFTVLPIAVEQYQRSKERHLGRNRQQVFLSYCREDADSAQRLASDLQRSGFDVWLDTERLSGGSNWKVEIQGAIRGSEVFIALLSKASLSKRGYVQAELREAFEVLRELPQGDVFLVPVRLDDSKPMDIRLRDLQWIDLFPSYSLGFERLKADLAGTLARRQS